MTEAAQGEHLPSHAQLIAGVSGSSWAEDSSSNFSHLYSLLCHSLAASTKTLPLEQVA